MRHLPAYVPQLDGVRGVAVLAVLALHLLGVPGGWLGVDLFFALSAFLVTSLIINEVSERGGRYSFRDFYARRVLRLGPALVLWLVVLAAPTTVLLGQTDLLLTSTAVSLFYLGDFADAFWIEDFGKAYHHVWSLAVEEQFYLCWPPIAVLLMRLGARTRLTVLTVGMVAAVAAFVPAVRIFGGFETYVLPVGHLIPLAGGALAAHLYAQGMPAALERLARSWPVGAALAGLLAFGIARVEPGVAYSDPRQGVVLLLACPAIMLHLALATSGWLLRVLTIRPLLWVGVRSYAIYLFHLTIMIAVGDITGRDDPSLPDVALVVVLTLGLAWASYRWVERPIRHRGRERLASRSRRAAATSA